MRWMRLAFVFTAAVLTVVKGKCQFLKQNDCAQDSALTLLDTLTKQLGEMKVNDSKTDPNYEYTIRVCEGVGGSTDTGVLQKDLKDKKKKPTIIGLISKTCATAWDRWLLVDYHGGDRYQHSCSRENRLARLMFTCSVNATEPVLRVVEEFKGEANDCYYMFEIRHKALCTNQPNTSSSSKLSTGSILIIIFFTFIAAYLMIGAAYQRFLAGAKGIDQIPHLEFWQDFGNLQADGCDFVCRGFSRSRQSQEYRGINGDQMIPEYESDTARDDSLLPM